MGVHERRARQKDFLRQEILRAASELFVREGYENVSMRRIADRIEYSPTTIYLYFQDKAELLENVCSETFARLVKRLSRIEEQTADPLECLKRGLLTYIEFGLENPDHYRATFMMPIPAGLHRDKKQPRGGSPPGMQAFSFLRRGVAGCIEKSKLPALDVELASQTLWAGIHGITSLLITHSGFPWAKRERLIQSMVNTLLAGLPG